MGPYISDSSANLQYFHNISNSPFNKFAPSNTSDLLMYIDMWSITYRRCLPFSSSSSRSRDSSNMYYPMRCRSIDSPFE